MRVSMHRKARLAAFATVVLAAIGLLACAPPPANPVRTVTIPDGTVEPKVWGEAYPLEYESWQKTGAPRPTGKSVYKRGFDTDRVVYDKLSEFPYMALLFRGWGFGIEYNEPRGHAYMLSDQLVVDPSRVKAGGACLTCKTPYADRLVKENGRGFFSTPYLEAVAKIPAQHKELGVACIDCHDNKTMSLSVSRWTIQDGLKTIGRTRPGHQDMRSIVCGQCHCTYVVTKDADARSTGVIFPWAHSTWGDVSIENIIRAIRSRPENLEWKQAATGFKLGFIRHPEFEFFTDGSVHFKAGVSCADCHMPYKRSGPAKISDHNVMSPLKNGMRACRACHPSSPEVLKSQVVEIQKRTVSQMLRSGYSLARVAKLFERANEASRSGTRIDPNLYGKAKNAYIEAFYRVTYLGAENSVGFHNPSEAGRIAADALAFSGTAEALLRQALAKSGIDPPAQVRLELSKYLNGRGQRKLAFKRAQEFTDPYGLTQRFISPEAKGL